MCVFLKKILAKFCILFDQTFLSNNFPCGSREVGKWPQHPLETMERDILEMFSKGIGCLHIPNERNSAIAFIMVCFLLEVSVT